MLLTTLKHTRNPAVYLCRRCCSSPRSSGGLSSLQDEVMVGSSLELVRTVGSQVEMRPGFITEEEEAVLLQELEPGLRKKRYEFDHWDDVRRAYRDCRDMTVIYYKQQNIYGFINHRVSIIYFSYGLQILKSRLLIVQLFSRQSLRVGHKSSSSKKLNVHRVTILLKD